MDQLSRVFGALADPTRRAILARLATGEATVGVSVGELAEPFAMSLQAVSKHLKVLERAGLITRSASAQWRPAQLNGPALGEAGAFLLDFRQFWEDSFDAMNDHLRSLTEKKRQS